MALRINAENFEEKVLKADKPVLVDFYSDTCISMQTDGRNTWGYRR